MAHWGFYWGIKRKDYRPKKLCSGFWLHEIDSFDMFNKKTMNNFLQYSNDRTLLEIPQYNLTLTLQNDGNLYISYNNGNYIIVVEKKPCNYGGSYSFFRCPQCANRMRKLYCLNGKYLCRKCANLGYKTQRLRPSRRLSYMEQKIEEMLIYRAGSRYNKPPRMHKKTYQKIISKHINYQIRGELALDKELLEWYGERALPYLFH